MSGTPDWVAQFNNEARQSARNLEVYLEMSQSHDSWDWIICWPSHVCSQRVIVTALRGDEELAFHEREDTAEARRDAIDAMMLRLRGKINERREDGVRALLEELMPQMESEPTRMRWPGACNDIGLPDDAGEEGGDVE